uniref:Uncharacterized protein n=1 Tax=Pseudomonas aeruginosa TaxID=287 RepID=A0A5P9WB78_PSEAI|nr:hypothetical protein PNK5461_c0013 [Pseudomonas aeruginosa]
MARERTGGSLRLIRGILDAFPRQPDLWNQVHDVDGHLQGVIEVDVLHQLLIGRAGRIRSTRCSAPPAPMATCRA